MCSVTETDKAELQAAADMVAEAKKLRARVMARIRKRRQRARANGGEDG